MSVASVRTTTRQLARIAEELAVGWLLSSDPTPEGLAEALPALVGVCADSAALLAAQWYDSLNEKSSYSAFLDDDMSEEKSAAVAAWVFDGPQLPESRVRVAANRLVFDAPRRTVFANAAREGVAIARHEEAECCNRCIVRATTTERHRKASSEDVDQFFHPACEGLFVPVRVDTYVPPDHAREWHPKIELARQAGNVEPDDIAKWLTDH